MTRKFTLSLLAGIAGFAFATSTRAADATPLSKTDRLLIKAQKICPVMGRDLTKVASPLKATVGGQTVFLCCKACFKGTVQKKHWDQIQANLAAAQGKCPVFNKPLPKNPRHVVVKGRKVFVCCPPCIRKVQAEPDKYLAIVDKLLEANLRSEPLRK
jgi:YHS domain-containing protein